MQKKDTTVQKPQDTTRETKNFDIENLAEMISEVLKHQYTPDCLSNKIIDALCELNNSSKVWENPRAVEALLSLHNAKQRSAR